MKASVVLLSWNGMEFLPACLDALQAQDYADFEVVVVDNSSSDGSADFMAEQHPHVQLLRNEYNLGFAGATTSASAQRQATWSYSSTRIRL